LPSRHQDVVEAARNAAASRPSEAVTVARTAFPDLQRVGDVTKRQHHPIVPRAVAKRRGAARSPARRSREASPEAPDTSRRAEHKPRLAAFWRVGIDA
jgi:hypothetical protein